MSWQMMLGSMEVLSESVSLADNLPLSITIASSMGTLVSKLFTSKLTIKSPGSSFVSLMMSTKCDELLMKLSALPVRGRTEI